MTSAISNTAALRGDQLQAEEHARLERKARRFWVGLVVGFLGLQVAIGMFSLYVAVGGADAVIPNYHQAALDWDIKQREVQTLARLGWDVSVVATPVRSGKRGLQVLILGAQGQRIEQQRVSGTAFHHAAGRDLHDFLLQETDAGLYTSSIPLTQAGLWRVDLTIEGDHGIASKRVDIEVE
jgi:hypothetical protein